MKRWQADSALGLIALIWGSTFVIVQNTLDTVPPMTLVAWRFGLAAAFLMVLFHRKLQHITHKEILAGGLCGLWLANGYIFQTIGLQSTTTSKAGFITGLSVVIVPFLSMALLRRPPGRGALIGIVAATVGLGFLSLEKNQPVQKGDLWVLAGAFMFALHIITVSHFSPRFDSIRLAMTQIAVVALFAAGAALLFEQPTVYFSWSTWGDIAFLGVVATALVFSLQVYVQRFTTPTHTALLFSLEPVFAAFFGWWWAHEILDQKELIGCGLILAGMIVAELGSEAVETEAAEDRILDATGSVDYLAGVDHRAG